MKKQKGAKEARWTKNLRLPREVLQPVGKFLQEELRKLIIKEKALKKADPFANPDRAYDNAADPEAYPDADYPDTQSPGEGKDWQVWNL